MKRAIVTAATLAPAALAELKDWLGITTVGDDAGLVALLRASIETCEAFTGSLPLVSECEEAIDVAQGWQALSARPVLAITSVQGITTGGARLDMAAGAWAADLRADGSGWVRVLDPGAATGVAVRFTAGLATDWAGLPDGLRHGIVRLAAHGYRQRDTTTADGTAMPPAAVAALWRPWRAVRLL